MNLKIDYKSDYNTWFNSKYYHILYKDRDDKEAKKFILNLTQYLDLSKKATILDAACGKGRHSIEIEKLGYSVTGIDLSVNSINHAKKFENSNLKFFVHDILIPFGKKFDAVFNLFTSFGYYNRDKDIQTLSSINENLKENGIGVIDFLNIYDVRKKLVKKEIVKKEGIHFDISRKITKKTIQKIISFNDSSKNFTFKESVNYLDLNDFKKYFIKTNLEIIEVFGDYELNKFDKYNSSRLIILFKKKSRSN